MPTARPHISAVPGGEHLHVSSAVLTLSIYIFRVSPFCLSRMIGMAPCLRRSPQP